MIKMDRLTPYKKEAALTKIINWMYIMISTPIFVTAQIPPFSQGA